MAACCSLCRGCAWAGAFSGRGMPADTAMTRTNERVCGRQTVAVTFSGTVGSSTDQMAR